MATGSGRRVLESGVWRVNRWDIFPILVSKGKPVWENLQVVLSGVAVSRGEIIAPLAAMCKHT